jgi:hypothetical protein
MPRNIFYFVLSRVVREQYCMCTPTTKLEKRLVITVATLAVVITLLLVVIIVLLATTRDGEDPGLKKIVRALTPNF